MTAGPSAFPSDAPSSSRRSGGRLYLCTFAIFLGMYAATTQTGPAWQDSGIFQWRIYHFDLVGGMGLALAHPLLIVLGKAFSYLPFGPLPWRMNLVSALCAAAAVANVALLIRRLVPNVRWAAWVGGGMFGLAHSVWWLATICESQALHVALFTASLHVLVSLERRPQVHLAALLGLLNGLALTAHNLALLALPAYGLMVIYLCARRGLCWCAAPAMVGGWLIGASGLLVMIVRACGDVGFAGAVRSALFGSSWQSDVFSGSGRPAVRGAGYLLYNFPNLAIPLAIVGAASLRIASGSALRRALGYLVVIYLVFAIRYPVPDQFMFFLPFYAMVSILAGVGLGRLCAGGRRRWLIAMAGACAVLTPILYAAAPTVWRTFQLPLPERKDLPYRDAARYWLVPCKAGEDSAGEFAREAMREVPGGATIIADATSYYPLVWVQAVESLGSGIRVLPLGQASRRRIPVGTADVFVVSNVEGYYPGWLGQVASMRKDKEQQVLFRVVWREAPATVRSP